MNIGSYSVGQKVTGRATIRNGVTTPPKPFTDGDLVSIMQDVSRYTEISKSSAAILREKDSDGKAGIGTARTRGSIIKGLFDRGQVEFIPSARGKKASKYIRPTEKGVLTYRMLKQMSPSFVSPELTAKWEEALRMVERCEITIDQFTKKQKEFCSAIAGQIKASPTAKPAYVPRPAAEPIPPMKGDGDICPKCKKGKLVTRLRKDKAPFLRCSDASYDRATKKASGCDYVDWGDKK